MTPKCLIRWEMQKKKNFGDGGEWRRRWSRRRFFLRYQNLGQLLTQSKRFYPIISKTKGVALKIKLLVYHGTRRDILPPPLFWNDCLNIIMSNLTWNDIKIRKVTPPLFTIFKTFSKESYIHSWKSLNLAWSCSYIRNLLLSYGLDWTCSVVGLNLKLLNILEWEWAMDILDQFQV